MSLISARELSKHYPGVYALDNLTVDIEPGIIGFVGANGAGKSTFIRILLGLLAPTSGTATVLGFDVQKDALEVRKIVGYMPEHDCLPLDISGTDFVAHMGQMAGLPFVAARERAAEMLRHVGLHEERYRLIGSYSTGMKQRIKLAQAIVHDPDLLFLDEPTNGMDPKGRDEMLELIHDLAHNKNVNLILSSHLLPDVEYTCDHVVVMDKGTIATYGPITALKGTAGRVYELRIKGDEARFIEVLKAAGYEVKGTDEDVMRVFVPGATDDSTKVLFALASKEKVQVRHLRPSIPTLEDVFARAVGET